jgi:hypothetical protein
MSYSIQPIATKRLTKSFLMSLTEGVYLVSNICQSREKSIFEEHVVSHATRREQWNQIKQVGADNRLCDVFRSRAHYEEFQKAFPRELSHSDASIEILEALLDKGHHGNN